MASASPESAALRARAFELAYNLDYDEATREMEAAARADANDAAAERGLAVIPWLMITFSRGAVTVDDYLGSVSKPRVALRDPPADLAERFHRHAGRALAMAEAAVGADSRDPEAHYQLGAVVGLRASYVATVEGRVLGAFRQARRAYDAHERVLALSPARKDAGLVVGMYRYLVSQLSMPLRAMAYVAGFGGGKERGLAMVEDASKHPGDAGTEARFALILLYNRESRFDDALAMLAQLRREYPRNRILWLETGATALRAGRPAHADGILTDGLQRLAADRRPRMMSEDALWHLKRGTARVALDRPAEARADLERALSLDARRWVHGRAHAELAKLADLRGDHDAARSGFKRAALLAAEDNDPLGRAEAQRWMDRPYRRGAR